MIIYCVGHVSVRMKSCVYGLTYQYRFRREEDKCVMIMYPFIPTQTHTVKKKIALNTITICKQQESELIYVGFFFLCILTLGHISTLRIYL